MKILYHENLEPYVMNVICDCIEESYNIYCVGECSIRMYSRHFIWNEKFVLANREIG